MSEKLPKHYREVKLNAYKIVMSKGDPIKFDEDELDKVWRAITTSTPACLKQGIFNPSFYVSIVEDDKRIEEVLSENARAYDHNVHDLRYGDGKNQIEYKGLEPLKDIFADCKHLPEAIQKRLNQPKYDEQKTN